MFGKVAAADVIAKGVPMSEHPAIADVRRTNQASAATGKPSHRAVTLLARRPF